MLEYERGLSVVIPAERPKAREPGLRPPEGSVALSFATSYGPQAGSKSPCAASISDAGVPGSRIVSLGAQARPRAVRDDKRGRMSESTAIRHSYLQDGEQQH